MTPMEPAHASPDDPAYVGRYAGGVAERDGALPPGDGLALAHGPVRRTPGSACAATLRKRAKGAAPLPGRRCWPTSIAPASGHVSEVADGDPPHASRGCPFQAWSVGEALRLDRVTLRA